MTYDLSYYGNSALRRKAETVGEITDETRQLAQDLLDTMYANKGLGLAAEQIGRTEAVCVVDVPPMEDENGELVNENPDVAMPLVLVDPEITDSRGKQNGSEGCLSFPEIFATVERAVEVTVEFVDIDGARRTVEARGLLARAIQHELDHLAGILLVDRMSPVKRVAISGKLKRLKRVGAARK